LYFSTVFIAKLKITVFLPCCFSYTTTWYNTDDVVSNYHQCGKPCNEHTNCANEACHLLFIQCDECSENTENTCSTDCQEVIQLSFEAQKELRKGKGNSNKIFKKGRSEVLKFKK
jgi:UPF0176 protein